MELSLWWLLALPLFFVLGWLAARIDIRQVVQESRALPRSYLNGLNFLLNEQPDKAIDAFTEAVAIDPQTIELHFALGSLFRRRGETERAIRLHQNLIEREDLDESQRVTALSALGQDYLKAGLLDRAEAAFITLQSSSTHGESATRLLLEIYQQEKEWCKAVEVARELPDAESVHWRTEVAHFYCELTAAALANADYSAAHDCLDEAFRINPRCVRASLLRGDVLVCQQRDGDAVEAWKRIENQNPAYLSLVGERVVEAFSRQGMRARGHILLRAWLAVNPSLDLLEQVCRDVEDEEGIEAAYALVRHELERNPTLLGLEKFLDTVGKLPNLQSRDDLEMVRKIIHAHTRRVARYCCDNCGFKARQFQWRCPACGGWETYPPRRSEEFDLAP